MSEDTFNTRTSLGKDPSFPGGRALQEPRFPPGTVIAGRYRIFGLAGRGGMGEVYRADDLKLGQPVALKFLAEALEHDADRLARFLHEVRIARQVAHPNVCRTYDVDEVDGRHFLSMEYVDGEDLSSLLRRIGRLPEDKALEIARQLCAGLGAAHELGILHRDLKPSNVMIDGRGTAKIADFGLAGYAEGFQGAEVRVGTPAYMAPEQLEGRGVTVQSDLYALGLVLYELVAGRPAFEAATPVAEITRHRTQNAPQNLSHFVPNIDPRVEPVILRCLEADPAERPSSALAVAAALPGGDALTAALAAGETPSPELVAAAGSAAALRPRFAATLALGACVTFLVTAYLGGRLSLRAWVPLDKPPVVLIDRAQEIVRELGYTEPIYAEPTDRAAGFDVSSAQLAAIAASDSSAVRWERLRSAELGVVGLWLRQSPRPMVPTSEDFGTFAGGPVTRWNPFPQVTGMITIGVDTVGRLRFFAHAPRRFDPAPIAHEPDWTLPFALAGLDPATFRSVAPGFQRFMHLDERAAWIGNLPGRAGEEVRIEAGSSGGRLALWAMLDPAQLDYLASEPVIGEGPPLDRIVFIGLVLGTLAASAVVAQRNLRRGRADQRGTVRLAAFVFLVSCARELLRSHALFTSAGLTQLFPIVATGLFYAAMSAALYLAIEPYGRRIWPSMLVSWTRLLARTRSSWRDPRIGRSVLWGLAAGSLVSLSVPLAKQLTSWMLGVPSPPLIGYWEGLMSTGLALADLAELLKLALIQGFVTVFLLVLARRVTHRPWAAVLLAAAAWVSFSEPVRESWFDTLVELTLNTGFALVFLLVLLRQGVLALIVTLLVVHLGPVAYTVDPTAWHSRPALYAMLLVAALAAYGWWAATPRSSPALARG